MINIIWFTLSIFLDAIRLLVLVSCVLSFIPIAPNRFTRTVNMLVEPLLEPIRLIISKITGGRSMPFDLSPIVLLLFISYVLKPLINILITVLR